MRENTNNNMDSFYEENAQFTGNNSLKRPLTLDLNNPKNPKRQRFNQSVTAAPVLSSPDLHMLKLASPELEKIILNAANLPTPTPLVFPTKVGHKNHSKKFIQIEGNFYYECKKNH
jgi:Jun-like transcription factor